MTLESIVNVTITSNSRGISRKSFGIPLVVGKHDNWGERFKTYNAGTVLADLVSDGFTTYDPIYKAAQGLVSNTPKIQTVAVGRLVTSFTHISTLQVQATVTVGDIYAFTLRAPDGTTTAISYTAQSGDTPTLVATAVAALIDAVTDISSASVTDTITNTADNTDEMWQFEGVDTEQFAFLDTTADSNLAAEIGEIEALYPDWYGLYLADPNSNARVLAVAAYVETLEKIFGYTTYDTDNGDPLSTTSTMYDMNAAQYFRSYGLYSEDQNSRGAATWMGNRFPIDPGSSTWAYKALSGTTFDTITSTFETALRAVKGNFYTKVSGLPVTQTGQMASGEWIDVIRGRDWFVAQIRERIFSVLANAPKVPYTDGGVALIVKEVRAAQQDGIAAGFLAADPEPFVTAPLVADVSDANKIARILPDIYFEQTLAGAIHAVTLSGVLKV